MSISTVLDQLRQRADDALAKLRGLSDRDLREAKGLVEELRNAREYDRMGHLAEAVSRQDPKDPKNRRLYASIRSRPARRRLRSTFFSRCPGVCRKTIPSSPRPPACSAAPISRCSSMPAIRPVRARATR
jgi:hypothetical protein